MIVVTVVYNTDEHGVWVGDETDDSNLPRTHHGPFATVADAERWMNEDYPDGDTDVRDIFVETIPDDAPVVNNPKDIR